MESIVPSPTTATATISPASLLAAFGRVPDPRRSASVIYPLPAMLALTVAALLCAQTSVLAIAEWAARQPTDLLSAPRLSGRVDPASVHPASALGQA